MPTHVTQYPDAFHVYASSAHVATVATQEQARELSSKLKRCRSEAEARRKALAYMKRNLLA